MRVQVEPIGKRDLECDREPSVRKKQYVVPAVNRFKAGDIAVHLLAGT